MLYDNIRDRFTYARVCVCVILVNHYLNCTASEPGGVICMIYVSREYIVPGQWNVWGARADVTHAHVPMKMTDDNYSKLNRNTQNTEYYY